MKVVILRQYGDVNELSYEEDDLPAVGAGEVRVRLHATSINPIDWKIRSGVMKEAFPLDLPEILGVDLAGEVDEIGPGVTGWEKGERVMAKAGGTYAEYTVAKANTLSPIPDALSYEQAAALPLILLTGTQLIEKGAKVEPGQAVLVTGALGSVGRVAVHVAQQKGARVLAGVRASQRAEAEKLGASEIVALDDLGSALNLHDLDAIADTVGGLVADHTVKLLRDNGVFATVVVPPAGDPARGIQIRPIHAVPDASRLYELAEEVARGGLIIPVAKTFPLSAIREATIFAEKGGAAGKVVLTIA